MTRVTSMTREQPLGDRILWKGAWVAARCGADGNKMMQFQCRTATGPDGVFGAGVTTFRLNMNYSSSLGLQWN
uniref:Uncharacterized protein n=1 Tax=Oryza barthii TaxID=65489 RepID=A0A0D3GZ29_9ORYZ